MKDIIKKTVERLDEDKEWIGRYMEYLDDIFNNSNKIEKGFHKPQGLSVYTTIGDRNNKYYYLRFKGQNVARIRVSVNGDIMLKCLVKPSKTHNIIDCPLKYNEEVTWNSKEASKFRSFFKHLSIATKTKSPEHEVENALLEEFRKKYTSKKTLRNIQPVLLQDNFFQMPTPLKASTHEPTYSKQSGGGIDMLARIKTKQGHTRICVIEIKDENKSSESQMIAMSQAITYATFVSKLLIECPEWMEFFMGHKSQIGRNTRSLDPYDIEVVTIMPEGRTETFENQILEIPGTKYKLHCHSIYYNTSEFMGTRNFKLSGTFLGEIKE